MTTAKKKSPKAKMKRPDRIRRFLAGAKGMQTLMAIREGIKDKPEDAKFVAAILVRMKASKEVVCKPLEVDGRSKLSYALKKAPAAAPKKAAPARAKVKTTTRAKKAA